MILLIFFTFLKIGFLGFGGGYAMLSLIFEEASKFGMTADQFADLNALDVLIPGPIAVNSATYVGQLYGGFSGALAATAAVSIPSLIFVPIFMLYEKKINCNSYLNAALTSVKAASAGLISAVALSLMLTAVINTSDLSAWQYFNFDWFSLIIMTAGFISHIRYKINPVVITLAAGAAGWCIYFI